LAVGGLALQETVAATVPIGLLVSPNLKIDTKLRAWRLHKPQSPWSSSFQENPNPACGIGLLVDWSIKTQKFIVFDDVGIASRTLRWI
jgi:hypothetical protein